MAFEAVHSDWLRLRAFHHGPGCTHPNGEAEDTTAVSTAVALLSEPADNANGNDCSEGDL